MAGWVAPNFGAVAFRLVEAQALLRRLEFSYEGHCPLCDHGRAGQHAEDCDLAEFLAGAPPVEFPEEAVRMLKDGQRYARVITLKGDTAIQISDADGVLAVFAPNGHRLAR